MSSKFLGALLFVFSLTPNFALAQSGASLSLSPTSGTFTVGSTFTVSVILNTGGQAINAIEANLSFPPDKLQVVSPLIGTSIIGIWTNQPQFDNQKGTLRFQGGIPDPGITTSRGVVANITFRVKSVGTASMKFLDSSKTLLNDGLATDFLANTSSGIYNLTLPPPAGPLVVSETHPDQTIWYKNSTTVLRWTNNFPVDGYSYILNEEPIDIPDDIVDNKGESVVYRGLVDRLHFFHIKALRSGVWGEASHLAVKIDTTPPADFPIKISPAARTSSEKPLIYFSTSDALSGMDHYELKIVSRQVSAPNKIGQNQSFFIEASSPYSPELSLGKYDAIVRAYDKAGNFREVAQKIVITTPILSLLGFEFLPRWAVVILGTLALLALIYFTRRVVIWHREIHLRHLLGAVKDPEIAARLKYLQEKRSEYLKHLVILLATCYWLLTTSSPVQAQTALLASPIITTIAKDITDAEIFYIGGKAPATNSSIVVYLQNLHDGQTFSQTVEADNKGDWFYSYPNFLSPGRYLIWVQAKFAGQVSAPSPQYEVGVSQTALQFGASRISLETLYLIFVIVLFLGIVGLLSTMIYHVHQGKKKKARLTAELAQAEEAIKKGFMVLHHDLQSEIALLHKRKSSGPLTSEEQEKEQKIMKDLDTIGRMIEKEVKDVERLLESQY
ncbi:MAG: cohesin domain-containing protein [Dehalococcoidales bacterium]|nr:cohesin domain-containing protein [Dehalococcoidales bacterium]